MQEALLHYIWQYQKFSSSKLYAADVSALVITRVGTPNLRSGPDFLNAKLYFDALTWSGPVEIHVKSSDWYRHAHQLDSNYDNVILHVVWEHDTDIIYSSGKKIPTLQLKDFVNKNTLELYKK